MSLYAISLPQYCSLARYSVGYVYVGTPMVVYPIYQASVLPTIVVRVYPGIPLYWITAIHIYISTCLGVLLLSEVGSLRYLFFFCALYNKIKNNTKLVQWQRSLSTRLYIMLLWELGRQLCNSGRPTISKRLFSAYIPLKDSFQGCYRMRVYIDNGSFQP